MKNLFQKFLNVIFCTFFVLTGFMAHAIKTVEIDTETIEAYQDSVPGDYYLQTNGSLLRIVNHGNRNLDFEYYGKAPEDVEFVSNEVKVLINGGVLKEVTQTELFHERAFQKNRVLFILTYPFKLPQEELITYYRFDTISSNVHLETEVLPISQPLVLRMVFWSLLLVMVVMSCMLSSVFETRWARVLMGIVISVAIISVYVNIIIKQPWQVMIVLWPVVLLVLIYSVLSTKKTEIDW